MPHSSRALGSQDVTSPRFMQKAMSLEHCRSLTIANTHRPAHSSVAYTSELCVVQTDPMDIELELSYRGHRAINSHLYAHFGAKTWLEFAKVLYLKTCIGGTNRTKYHNELGLARTLIDFSFTLIFSSLLLLLIIPCSTCIISRYLFLFSSSLFIAQVAG